MLIVATKNSLEHLQKNAIYISWPSDPENPTKKLQQTNLKKMSASEKQLKRLI